MSGICRPYEVHGSEGIRPDPVLSYVEWADRHFYLSRESSSEYGRYRSSRTPFVREPLEELSPESPTQVVVCMKPTQCAGTTIGLIFLCGMMDMHPGPAMMVVPTDPMGRSFSKKKLSPAIRNVPSLRGKVAAPKSRDSGNTILVKEFQGGSLAITGAGAAASFRAESIKYLILDDFDGFEGDIEGEGSPEELADRRTGTFAGRKVYINSTTTTKGISNIERAFEHSSQGHFHVPCPHCGAYQYLVWGGKDADFGIQFERDEDGVVTDAWYLCEHCHQRIDESHKPAMLAAGRYIHKHSERRVKGYRWNALYTPLGWVNDWKYIAQKFVTAAHSLKQGNPAPMKTWLNSFMSEPYEEKGDQPDWVKLKARCEPYQPMNVPEGARVLTAGVDVQHNRLAVSVWGWGAGEESWLIYHIELYGDPLQQEIWGQLDDLLLHRTYQHAGGTEMHVVSIGVDASDGATTQAVRNYCRSRAPRVFALKGASSSGKPVISAPAKVDIDWRGEHIEGGVEMWSIGTDTAKSTIYARLNSAQGPGPGYVHFYAGLEDEYFEQLTAEKLITRWVKGYPVREWHNVRGNKRNEALDCNVYAYAAALRAGINFIDLQGARPMIRPQLQRQPRPGQSPRRKQQTRRW